MATRTLNKLPTKQVEALGPGRHSDGGALYLVVDEGGRRNWSFQPKVAGKRREIGVGPAGKGGVPLAQARKEAALMQEDVRAGRDPKAERDKRRAAPVTLPAPHVRRCCRDTRGRSTATLGRAATATTAPGRRRASNP